MKDNKEQLKLLADIYADAWIDYYEIKNEKGDRIEWLKHQFLIDIYNDQSDNLVVIKAAQIGMSTLAIIKSFRDAEANKMDIIYTLPTDSDVSIFVGGKANRIIANNPKLESLTTDKDSIEQKQVGQSMIYFRGCIDEDTEVLTYRGWLKYDEIKVGDHLPSLDIKTNKIMPDKVLDLTIFDTNEEMVRIKSSLIDQLVTKDHRCIIAKRKSNGQKSNLRIERAHKMIGKTTAYIPTIFQRENLNIDSFYSVIGWVIGDGSFWIKRDKYKDKVYKKERVCIVQSKLCNELEDDLKLSGIKYYKKSHNKNCFRYEISYTDSRRIRRLIPEKKLTFDLVFSSSIAQLNGLYRGLMYSDGDNKKHTTFWQRKNGTADAFQALLVLLGLTSNLSDLKNYGNRFGVKQMQRVRIRKNEWTNPQVTTENYHGKAWCPTTMFGTIFVRRNGKVSVTGQTWSKKAAIMITADRLIHDEKDSSKQDVIADFQARLQHSKFKQTHVFSHPSAPNSGVDIEWRLSDQKEWFIDCPHCDHMQMLSWNIEDDRDMSICLERRIFQCKKCKKELHWKDRAVGQWLAKKGCEDAKWSGYHISLLMAAWVSAEEIINKYEDAASGKQTMDYFYNKVLGLPYAGSGNSVTEEMIKGAVTSDENLHKGRIVIGVDTGIKLRYVYGNKQGLLGYGEMTDYMPDKVNGLALNQTLEYFLKEFSNSIMVIDQGGDIIGARKLRAAYPGRVYLCHYARDRKTMKLIRWGSKDENGNVTADRNRMIQLVIDELKDRRWLLYRGTVEQWHEYWLHWSHIYRVSEVNTLGITQYKWMRSDRDDWVHATVYWRIGLDRFGGKGGIVGVNEDRKPNSVMIDPGHSASFDPNRVFGDAEKENVEWWADEDSNDWRDI